jgi:hypothetical protein
MIVPYLIINTYVSLMYELKKIGKVFTSKSVGTGPSSYEKIIYRAAVWQMLTGIDFAVSEPGLPFDGRNQKIAADVLRKNIRIMSKLRLVFENFV